MTIRLVPFGDEHLAAMAATIRDPEILRFTPTPDPTPADWLTTWRSRFDGVTRINWAITDTDVADHEGFVGYAVAFDIDRATASLELGYAVAPWARDRGVATEALRLLTAWAQRQRMRRLTLLIDPGNRPSLRVAAKCGYACAGPQGDLERWIRDADGPPASQPTLRSPVQ